MQKNRYNETPLHLATMMGLWDVIMKLLDKGADLSIRDDRGRTPFDVAMEYGYEIDFMVMMLKTLYGKELRDFLAS